MEFVNQYLGLFLDYILQNPEWILYTLLGLLLVGVILGWKETIVVYRNFNDLGLVFSIVLIPLGVMFFVLNLGVSEVPDNAYYVIGVIEVLVISVISYQTWKDNPNPFKWFLAMYTKIPLGILFIIVMMDFLIPQERRAARKRQGQLALLLLLAPVVLGLVKDKNGLFGMQRTIARIGARI